MKQLKVEDLTCIWLKYKKRTVKQTSFQQYQRIVNNHINPYLGDILLDNLTIVDVLDFIEDLGSYLSDKTIQDTVVAFKSILGYGIDIGYCNFPIRSIPFIRVDKKEVETLNDEELTILENHLIHNLTYKNLGLLICLYSGIRLGELCALTWNDINFDNNKIIVNKTISRIKQDNKSITIITTPKSRYSKREIPINTTLKEYLISVEDKHGYILTNKDQYLDPRSYQYYFKKILSELNIDETHFHVLRHTFATRCVQCNIDIKSLSEILGHSSTKITLDIYVHSTLAIKQQQMQKFSLT
ncbi:MAG: site-specific integrase [Erysipelotrichaceae bacterium]|nr:site-specific integrase [Erysipelotrichaceae bacterium]